MLRLTGGADCRGRTVLLFDIEGTPCRTSLLSFATLCLGTLSLELARGLAPRLLITAKNKISECRTGIYALNRKEPNVTQGSPFEASCSVHSTHNPQIEQKIFQCLFH